MKQLLQSLKNGSTSVADIPAPAFVKGNILVKTTMSLVSSGTERMLVEFGKSNLIQKARSQPDKVKIVMEKAQSDGIISTIDAVKAKMDQPLALGYCNVGKILKSETNGLDEGDRVVSNGKHAEIVSIPKNLCAKIPDNVSDETASFTILAAIGLQGIRLAQPAIGDCVVVIGLGLIGLLTVQILRAQGCRVLGVDYDGERLDIARNFGAEIVDASNPENIINYSEKFSRGRGVDSVIITASSKSNKLISQAAQISRKRAKIILVGVVGLDLNRHDFYEKELVFQVSCSYGPGRYDPNYEEKGQDYPIGFVRWTEQRNFEAILDLMSDGKLVVDQLITKKFDVSDGSKAMSLLTNEKNSLGILINYPQDIDISSIARTVSINKKIIRVKGKSIGFLGAGNYASRTLMPAFKSCGANLHTAVSLSGVSSTYFGKKYGFLNASSDESEVIESDEIDLVVIATRHNDHARQVLASLRAGKNVFCEKPLCLTLGELSELEAEAGKRPGQHLVVGFNRRFSPYIIKMKSLLGDLNIPKNIIITINAGQVPPVHWTQDKAVGGGRIIGEACHFVDLARHLIGKKITHHSLLEMKVNNSYLDINDNVTLSLGFSDGSSATIHYLSNGHKGYSKERIEVFVGGRILQLDNYRSLKAWGWKKFKKMRSLRQDKGNELLIKSVIHNSISGLNQPIKLKEIFEVSRVSIELSESLS